MKIHTLICSFAAVGLVVLHAAEIQRFDQTPIDGFSATGKTSAVIDEVAHRVRFDGGNWVEMAESPDPVIAISDASNLGDALKKLCKQDPRYRVVGQDDERVINLLSAKAGGDERGYSQFAADALGHRYG